MKTVRKTLILAACAILLVCATVVGTLAYLTSTATVKNTFTVGNVKITMDEMDVDDSTPNAERDTENKYKLLPGKTYVKDPTIHVDSNSEDCWLFVKVDNGLTGYEGELTIAKQLENNGWSAVDGEENVYVYGDKPVVAKDAANVKVFEEFSVASNVNEETLNHLKDAEINVTAYAVQGAELKTVADAWNAVDPA